MKHRNGIIRSVMKVPKKLYLAVAILIFIGGASTALALQPEAKPKKVEVQQVASTKPVEEIVPPVEVAQSPPAVVAQPVVQEEEPQETTQEKIKREVEALAVSIGLNDEAKWGKSLVSAQSFCMDRRITQGSGYDDNSSWQALLDVYMNGKQTDGGLTRMYYDGHGCAVKYFTTPN